MIDAAGQSNRGSFRSLFFLGSCFLEWVLCHLGSFVFFGPCPFGSFVFLGTCPLWVLGIFGSFTILGRLSFWLICLFGPCPFGSLFSWVPVSFGKPPTGWWLWMSTNSHGSPTLVVGCIMAVDASWALVFACPARSLSVPCGGLGADPQSGYMGWPIK